MYRQLRAMVVLLLGGLLLGLPTLCAAQEPPLVTGTIALEGTVDKIYAAANTVVVKATDGVEHLFHLTKRTAVHGTKNAGDAALSGLTEGNRVVMHYVAVAEDKTAIEVDRIAEDGLGAIEGVVTRVDREDKRLSIRLADGSTETLRLSEHAATNVGKDVDRAADHGATVIVYYTDDAGNKVAHYFKRIS